jgi:hypothetical protein
MRLLRHPDAHESKGEKKENFNLNLRPDVAWAAIGLAI